jgi:hypothetical protein
MKISRKHAYMRQLNVCVIGISLFIVSTLFLSTRNKERRIVLSLCLIMNQALKLCTGDIVIARRNLQASEQVKELA